MMGPTRVVFRKELVDNLRDRRALASALAYPLIGPVILVLMFTTIGRRIEEQSEKPLELPVVGAEHAPALVGFLEQHGVQIQQPPDEPERAVKAGDLDVVLVIPSSYAEEFSSGIPASVRLIVDESRSDSEVSVRRARWLLNGYRDQMAALRLMARGVSPEVVRPLSIETVDLATPQSQAANLLGMMPYFLIFAVFIGGMYLAIDSTAGERERGSLEPLLMNPISRRGLVLGKLSAVLVFTLISVVETAIVFAIVLNVIPVEELIGMPMSFSLGALIAVILIAIPILPLAAAIQIIIASFARSFKEAQNYISLLPLIPALPGLMLVVVPMKPEPWNMLIPTFSQQLLIVQVMRGETIEPIHAVVSAVVTLSVAAVAIGAAIKLYESERILFGRGK